MFVISPALFPAPPSSSSSGALALNAWPANTDRQTARIHSFSGPRNSSGRFVGSSSSSSSSCLSLALIAGALAWASDCWPRIGTDKLSPLPCERHLPAGKELVRAHAFLQTRRVTSVQVFFASSSPMENNELLFVFASPFTCLDRWPCEFLSSRAIKKEKGLAVPKVIYLGSSGGAAQVQCH